MGHLSHGVYVLGTRRGREMTAMTAAWVAQISERPPCLAVAVRDDRYTLGVILESATFSLSVLRRDQRRVPRQAPWHPLRPGPGRLPRPPRLPGLPRLQGPRHRPRRRTHHLYRRGHRR